MVFAMTPRIPPLPAHERTDEQSTLLAGLRMGDGAEPLNIFATLVRHPKLMKRWSAFGGTLLFQGRLSPTDRELLILRTAYRCKADYEWGQHVEIARTAGMTDEEIHRVPEGAAAAGWTGSQRALLIAADELHDTSVISDATWAALAADYDEQQLIEVPMLVGQYHLVAFTLNSLGVEAEPGLPAFPG